MSKAFTRESDLPDVMIRPRPVSLLPEGAKNYLTASGAKKLRQELDTLLTTTRPRLLEAAQHGGADEELQNVDLRMVQVQHTLQTAVVVDPPATPDDTVRFGATVTVRERNGEESTYRIVGTDEIDLDRNWVSWLSPIAKALINARAGQSVRFKFPSGEQELEILRVSYD